MPNELNVSRSFTSAVAVNRDPEGPPDSDTQDSAAIPRQTDGTTQPTVMKPGNHTETNHPALAANPAAGSLDDPRALLKSAALRGDTITAQSLLDTDIDAPQVLAQILHDHPDTHGFRAAKTLISLGVDITEALDCAADNQWHQAARTLVLLGGRAADLLAMDAMQPNAVKRMHASDKLETLIHAGADVAHTLISLAKNSALRSYPWAVQELTNLERRSIAMHSYRRPRSDETALLRLARDQDTATLRELSTVLDDNQVRRAAKQLANQGHTDAIKVLSEARLLSLQDMLRDFAHDGNLVAARTLINTGMKTAPLLQCTLRQNTHSGRTSPHAVQTIDLLLAVGADASALPAVFANSTNKRKAQLSDLALAKENEVILYSANTDIEDIAILQDQGFYTAANIKYLVQTMDIPYVAMSLTQAGVITPDVLIQLVKDGDIAVARALREATDATNGALIVLFADGDQETAQAFIPTLTDGQMALTEAVQNNNIDQAKALLAIGVDGPTALQLLMKNGFLEAASRLIALGVDVNATLTLAARNTEPAVQRNLIAIGADPAVVLNQAIELNDIRAAEQLVTLKGTSVGQDALLTLLDDNTLPADVKTARIEFLLTAGVNTDKVLETLALDGSKANQLKGLIAFGPPTASVLMDMAQRGFGAAQQRLILAGADFATAINTLYANNEQHAAVTLTMNLTKARDIAMDTPPPF